MAVTLYKRQRQIVDFIAQYIQKNGYSPTLKEIAGSIGVSSLATVHEHLQALVRKKIIRKHDGAVRGIELEVDSGIADGTATVGVTGGTPPYDYLWNDALAQTTAVATSLPWGDWTVIVTDDNGCTETGEITVVLFSTVNDISIATQVKLYPNPSNGLLNFDIRNYPDDELSIIIYTVNGQIIYSDQYELLNDELIETIDLSNQSAGMYYLKIISDNLNITEKIVLENK
jgi:SOS-response transcriptional repressor LexA